MKDDTPVNSSIAERAVVSVIVPIFNPPSGAVARSVQSVLDQSFQALEVILVNDGSCAPVAAELASLATVDPRIHLVTQNNRGVSAARNLGLERSRGSYVAFLDADDYLHPDFLQQAVSLALSTGSDIAFGAIRVQTRFGAADWRRHPKRGAAVCYTGTDVQAIQHGIMSAKPDPTRDSPATMTANVTGALYARHIAANCRFPDTIKHGEDRLFNLRALGLAQKVIYSPNIWYFYDRSEEAGVTSKLAPPPVRDFLATISAYFSATRAEVERRNPGVSVENPARHEVGLHETDAVLWNSAYAGALAYTHLAMTTCSSMAPGDALPLMKSILSAPGVEMTLRNYTGTSRRERLLLTVLRRCPVRLIQCLYRMRSRRTSVEEGATARRPVRTASRLAAVARNRPTQQWVQTPPPAAGRVVTYACIVTFNPDIERLRQNLEAVAPQVVGVIIVDNGSTDLPPIRELSRTFPGSTLVANKVNGGIARALNQAAERASEMGATFLVTLDQDSVAAPDMVETLVLAADENVGIAVPYIVDRNKTTVSAYQELILPSTQDHKQAARRGAITSGALTSLRAWASVGGFDEALFIDYVDYDFNQRLLVEGWRITQVNTTYLLHEVGKATPTWLWVPRKGLTGGWKMERFYAFGHSASRCYYKARNRIIFTRKYWRTIGITHEGAFQIPQQILLSLFFEGDRSAKLRAFARGIVDGLRAPLGR